MRTWTANLAFVPLAVVVVVTPSTSCANHVTGEGEGEGEGAQSGEGEGAQSGEGEGTQSGEGEGEGANGGVVPPFHSSSHGSGGNAQGGSATTSDGIAYILVPPSSATTPTPLMIVFSGVEGGQTMASNVSQAGPALGLSDVMFAVLDGSVYFGQGAAGASVLDDVRAHFDIDNDRTYLLSESAGTSAGLQLGFQLRQSYFAAYWANDVNNQATPSQNATALGFAPFGNAGPGGDDADAQAIVNAMSAAGYRIEQPAPYNGQGSTTHGDPNQFIAALQWFVGRSRQ
jgi:hypothetical protein